MSTKITIILILLFGINFSNAQNLNQNAIEAFLIDHTLEFNKNQKPIFCNNIDSMSYALKKKKINYSRCTYQFFTEVLSDSTLSGGCDTYILDTKKPFIYYYIKKDTTGLFIIELLDGNNYN
jgi:UDP-glucose 6-dehydrogenase